MTAWPAAVGLAGGRLLGELAAMIAKVAGEDGQWMAMITPASRLEADLWLDSVEMTALGELLLGRYGAAADLESFIAGLDIDQITGLTVGDLAAFLARVTQAAAQPGPDG